MDKNAHPWLISGRTYLIIGIIPSLLLICGLLYFTGWVIFYSFTDLALIGKKSIDWSFIGFDNYDRLFTRKGFLDSLWVTIIFVFFSAIAGQCLLGFALAVWLRGIKSKLKTFVEVAIMLGWLLPDIVAAFLWSATTSQTGLVNSVIIVPLGFEPINFINDFALPVVIVANIWKGSAWSYILFSAALDSVSKDVTEAAKVDGATPFQRIRLIIIPMIKSHIATNMLFITIFTFTYFPLIFAMTGGGPGVRTQVLSIFMYNQSFGVGKLGYGSAISVAMLIVVGVLSLFYLRLLKEPK